MNAGELIAVFLAGLAGSYHCLGMCGGIACGLAADPRRKSRTVIRHLTYNSGRVVTYIFLGAIAGTIGLKLNANNSTGLNMIVIQQVLTVVAGSLMILMATKFLAKPKLINNSSTGKFSTQTVHNPIKLLLDTQGVSAPLALGVLNGFLPCPLVYAFLTLAVTRANPLESMMLMAVFGLATFPAMLAAGSLRLRLRLGRKPKLARLAGLLILIFGLVTIARAFLVPFELSQHSAGMLP